MASGDGTMDPLEEDGTVECPTCSRSFANFGLVEKHEVEVHGADETMICRLGCDTLFKRRMTVIFHVRSQKHRGAAWIGCEICDAFTITNGFKNEKVLKEHTAKIHGKDVVLPPKSQDFNVSCPLCKRKFAQRKALIEHIQVLHTEHLYGHLMGLGGDAKKEFLDEEIFTCAVCLPDMEVTFKAKSALNRHTKRFHTKEALKRRAMSASPCKATNSKASRLSKSPDVKKKRRVPATAPVTPVTPVTTLAMPKTSPKSEPASASGKSKVTVDSGNKNPLLKNAPEETASKGSANRNPLLTLTNGVTKSSPLKTPVPSGGIFKQPLSTPRPTKSLVLKKSTNETRSSLPMAFRMNKCNFCQKSFSRESILNVHVEMIHKREKMELEMKTKEKEEGVRNSLAPLTDTKEKEEKDGENSSGQLVDAKRDKEECDSSATSINTLKEEPSAKEEIASNITSDAATAATAIIPTTAPALTNGCEGTESEESGMESEEEVFMEVEEEDIDLTNHPNLVVKKTSGVVVDKEWKGVYLSRKKADADAPSEENKRISARLRDKVNSNTVTKRKEISRETPPPVSKKRRKKEVTAEVVKKAPQELTEVCLYSEEQWGGCKRKFYSYFSMMRHVAFVHRPERTVEIMRITKTAQPIKDPAMPILMEQESKTSEGEETAKASEGAPESASSTTASSLNYTDESPGNVEQEGSSPNSNEKTEKEERESREDVKAVIEELVGAVVRREAPSSSAEEHSQPKREMQVGEEEEVSSLSSQGADTPGNDEVATVADDVPLKARDEPNSGGCPDSSKDKANGVTNAIEEPEAKDPNTEDLLDDTVEMEVAAACTEVVAAAN